MKTTNPQYIVIFFVMLSILHTPVVAISAKQNPDDPNNGRIVELGQEAKNIVYLAESIYWPEFDFKNVRSNISEPNSVDKARFTTIVNQIIDSNYLPEKLSENIHFLKGWRGKDSENFVIQYDKGPYLIRVKNQTTEVVASRVWTSHWITIMIQLKDKTSLVNKSNLNDIFNFTDKFLSKKVNSKVQNYSGVKNIDGTNMVKPRFSQVDNGYTLSYHVGASRPDIDGVNIWTDGNIVIINLQERRKVVFPASEK